MNCDKIINPYGEGKSAEKIVSLLGTIDIKKYLYKNTSIVKKLNFDFFIIL